MNTPFICLFKKHMLYVDISSCILGSRYHAVQENYRTHSFSILGYVLLTHFLSSVENMPVETGVRCFCCKHLPVGSSLNNGNHIHHINQVSYFTYNVHLYNRYIFPHCSWYQSFEIPLWKESLFYVELFFFQFWSLPFGMSVTL